MTNRVEQALKSASDTRALLVGQNVLSSVPKIFAEQFPGKKTIIIADPNTYRVAGKAVHEYLCSAGIEQAPPFLFTETEEFYADYEKVEQIESVVVQNDVIPIAVGSGTINDLVKLASHNTNRRYMCVATAASMDGYTAFGASITRRGDKQVFTCPAPQAVVADIKIISEAPPEMTAAGYADLYAKIPAGADWILADVMGEEAMEPTAWSIVQDGLQDALANPVGARKGEPEAITQLIEGLILGGFAMQWAKSSRCAAGAEHQFSHLWDMEHHTHNGKVPSHGFKVGLATLYVSKLYEQMLVHPFEQLDVAACCAQWLELEQQEALAVKMFSNTDFLETVLTEIRAKYITKEKLAQQLETFKANWNVIKKRLSDQLAPADEVERCLQLAGAPVKPEDIGITPERLRDSFLRSQFLRRRFTILDVAVRTACLDLWLDRIKW